MDGLGDWILLIIMEKAAEEDLEGRRDHRFGWNMKMYEPLLDI